MSAPRILMYCSSNRGLGRTARILGIAAALSQRLRNSSILVLTDLAIIGRFKLPERVDFIHLPALTASLSNSPKYGLRAENGDIPRLRQNILTGALMAFRPNLVWLDDSLLHLPAERHQLLSCLAENLPETKIVWGVSDTLGHPDYILREWSRQNVGEIFDRFTDLIFVFGKKSFFDVAKAYRLGDTAAGKLTYTGYLRTAEKPPRHISAKLTQFGKRLPLVLMTAEGGTEDLVLLDAYLRFLENTRMEVYSLIVAGLGLSSTTKHSLMRRVQALPRVTFKRFSKHLLSYVQCADAVICTGEYNIASEALAHRKAALFIPHPVQQPDNFHRAQGLQERGLVSVSTREDFQPDTITEFLGKSLRSEPNGFASKWYDEITFDGYYQIAENIQELIGSSPQLEAIVAS